jgi:hypothetical protein
MSEPRPANHIVAIVLAVLAAGALAYACVSKMWLYNPRNTAHFEVGMGLVQNYECSYEGECRTISNSQLKSEWAKQLEEVRQRAKEDPTDPQVQAFAAQAQEELRVSGIWPTLGWITLACCAIAALSLLVCAGIVLAKKRILWPIMPTTTAILGVAIGLIAGCVFVALKPGPPGYVGVQLGFFLFGAGVVVGIAATLMLNKQMRPDDPDLLEDSMNPEHY